MKPNPVRCSPVWKPQNVKRRVFCKHYDSCLDLSMEEEWENFSCEECKAYERERRAPEQWREEAQRCMALLYVTSFTASHRASR